MISAKILADSKNEFGHRITTMVVTFPRIILAEFNTHRMFSRNSASSRAIPTRKMIKMVQENPFIPIAWQKDHTGMQGFEYYDKNEKFSVHELQEIMFNRLLKVYESDDADNLEVINMFESVMDEFELFSTYTLDEFWCMIKDKVLRCTILLYCLGVTKQICNRLLEPFMWHTVIVTSTEWENFFNLRCPQYKYEEPLANYTNTFRSRSEWVETANNYKRSIPETDVEWLSINKGQAEIHMMALAEAMWDALNESQPKLLEAGMWHAPFTYNIQLKDTEPLMKKFNESRTNIELKIATAMCARVSYTVVGEEEKVPNYENDVKLHDRLASSGHWSPFEHCAMAMSKDDMSITGLKNSLNSHCFGEWSGNFRGFIQYRKTLPGENRS